MNCMHIENGNLHRSGTDSLDNSTVSFFAEFSAVEMDNYFIIYFCLYVVYLLPSMS